MRYKEPYFGGDAKPSVRRSGQHGAVGGNLLSSEKDMCDA